MTTHSRKLDVLNSDYPFVELHCAPRPLDNEPALHSRSTRDCRLSARSAHRIRVPAPVALTSGYVEGAGITPASKARKAPKADRKARMRRNPRMSTMLAR